MFLRASLNLENYKHLQYYFKKMKFNKISTISIFTQKKTSYVFIFVNVLVAFLGFVRSFAFMKFFDFRELGIITLINTTAMLVGFCQIGLINGGYRIIVLQKLDSNIKTNNVVFSYFGVITIVLFIGSLIAFFLGYVSDLKMLYFELAIGMLMLIVNWLTNTLIGSSQYRQLNIANIIGACSSMFCLIFAYYFGLLGAVVSLLIQPLVFVVIVAMLDKTKLPCNFDFDLKFMKYILKFGFIPFLAGIFVLLYTQIERWSINAFLGPEALGKLYFFFLTTMLWMLVPSSILNLLFPQAVRYYTNGNFKSLNSTINKSAILVCIYCCTVSLSIFYILNPIVGYIFPNHHQYFYLVILALPGLSARTLADPIAIFLNTVVQLKPIFWSDVFSIIIYILSIFTIFYFKLYSVENFIISFNIYFIVKFLFLYFSYLSIKSKEY